MKRGLLRSTSRMFLGKKQGDIDAALIKAKLAVHYDTTGDIENAMDAYMETVALLSRIKDEALVKIRETYAQRIEFLAQEMMPCTEAWPEGPPTPVSMEEDVWRHPSKEPFHGQRGSYWLLLKRLKQSMVQGAYLTDRLYAPKELWYQSNQALPDLDNKLALAEHLLKVLKNMRSRSEPFRILNELQTLEEALLKSNSVVATPAVPSTTTTTTAKKWRSSLGRQIQLSWKSSKLRIRQDAHASKTMDDRYHMYVRTLIKLFSAAQILDLWRADYADMSHCHHILSKIDVCTELLGHIVCSSVLGDFKLLWESWTSQGNQWMMD